jgi:YVTN family beta-propeller protein
MNFKFSIAKLKYIYGLLAAVFIFSGCSDNSTGPKTGNKLNGSVYVINEGNFGDSNGSITRYNPKTRKAVQKAFKEANNNRPLAGYIQSSIVVGDSLFIVSNSANKIEVTNSHTLESIGTIKYSKTPTFIVPVDKGKAYVTNLYDNSVSEVNLDSLKETGKTIGVGASPYFAYKAAGKVFVPNSGFGNNNTVSVIDIKSESVEKTLKVGPGPQQIVQDPNGNLWVVCQGKLTYDSDGNHTPENDVPGGIYIIDPQQGIVVDSLKTAGRPIQIALDAKDSNAFIVFAADSVSKVNMNTLQVDNSTFINRTFQSIGYAKKQQRLYLGESNGLTQPGKAIIYDLQGAPVDSFKTGISPVGFQFVGR